jgi:hypothetical protein
MSGKKDIINREIQETEKQMLLEQYKTSMKKSQFISEIKNGLGDDIKTNPGKAQIIKKTFFQRFMIKLKSIFTKF